MVINRKIFLCILAILHCQYVFALGPESIFYFAADGRVKNTLPVPVKENKFRYSSNIESDARTAVICNQRKFSGKPGDYITPVLDDGTFIWLISEKDCNFTNIVKWNPDTDKNEKIFIPNQDIVGIVSDGKKAYAIIYGAERWHYLFFDKSMKCLHQKILCENKNAVNIIWDERSPVSEKWLARISYSDRMESVILCDLKSQTYSFLSSDKKLSKNHRFSISYPASDGEIINAIVTVPEKTDRPLPLVVFPHGGPGATTMLDYDYRADFLASRGFVVFQPNYRGSHGFGKKFRQQGWGALGIKKQLSDIVDGTKYMKRQSYIDKSRCYVLGGSWGGYLSLALLTFEKNLFNAGVVLFGPSDLVAMLKTFPEKSKANKFLDKLQYGDINNSLHIEQLKQLSPLFHLKKLQVPTLVVHFKDDKVVEFEQTAELMRECRKLQLKNIHFIIKLGKHGFDSIAAESEFYDKFVDFFNYAAVK